jgi:hypothetical protein
MQRTARVIAVYLVVYSVVTQMPWWHESWRGAVSIGHPGPSSLVEGAAFAQKIILLAWLPLSVFVWLRYRWARWAVASSALVLGLAQLALYERMLGQYGSFSIVSEALVLAVPTFFLSALAFCPLVGQTFSRAADSFDHERI